MEKSQLTLMNNSISPQRFRNFSFQQNIKPPTSFKIQFPHYYHPNQRIEKSTSIHHKNLTQLENLRNSKINYSTLLIQSKQEKSSPQKQNYNLQKQLQLSKHNHLENHKKHNFFSFQTGQNSQLNTFNRQLILSSYRNPKNIRPWNQITHYTQKHNKNIHIKQKLQSLQQNRNHNQNQRLTENILYQSFKQNQRGYFLNQNTKIFIPKKIDESQYILSFSSRTKKGFISQQIQKVNQDNYIILPNIKNNSFSHFFGVCDGHGDYGHHVSNYIKQTLPNLLVSNQLIESFPKENLFSVHRILNEKLLNQSNIDLKYSGSTLNSCYFNGNKIFCSNVGDSRTIVGLQDSKNGKWKAKQLSIDHKPSQANESQRIIRSNGRIQSFIDSDGNHIGPLRVWLKDQKSPGLAMTRSYGDQIATQAGVIWQPQIFEYTIIRQYKIILIASDGIWDFLDNQDIINKLAPFYQNGALQQACEFLIQYANKSWIRKSSTIDDITFILIFMKHL